MRLAPVLVGLLAVCPPVGAAYPDRPVTVIVHTPAGGGTDTLARILFQTAGELTGATFVVENHPGAGGQIGYTRLATSEPDGYTVGAVTTMSIVTHELTRTDLPYRVHDSFQPLARIVLDPSVVVVRSGSPLETLDDLVRTAHREPDALSWAGTFLWGAHHVHYELLRRATGAELIYVPFDGAAESRAALLGGHVDVGAGGLSEYSSLVREGKARILAVASARRSEAFPDVPTYRDLGHDILVGSDRGFAVPAGTPPERVELLADAIRQALRSPRFIAAAETAGIAPTVAPLSGPDFESYLVRLQEDVRPLVDARAGGTGRTAALSGARAFPAMLILALLVLSCGGLARRALGPPRSQRTEESPGRRARLMLAAFVAIVIGFQLLLPRVGFAVSGTAFMAAGLWLLGGRASLRYLPLAALVPLALVLVFRYGLAIRLPAAGWP